MSTMHIGRSFTGSYWEDQCPCRQEDCGLVSDDMINPDCTQHRGKYDINQRHRPEHCPKKPAQSTVR
jgi:hypothetical protein